MNRPLKQEDLPYFISDFDKLYQKEKDSATGNGDQSKTPEAGDADTGVGYDNHE